MTLQLIRNGGCNLFLIFSFTATISINMENKYAEGSAVYALVNPDVKLVVRRYVERVYYCTIASDPQHDDLVYFERELAQVKE